MKNIVRSIQVFFLLMLISKAGNTQDHNIDHASDAVMLQINGNTRFESRLKSTVITLSNGSDQLNVKLNIPNPAISYAPSDDTMLSSAALPANLEININPWQIQDFLTSAKTFITKGFLRLNNTTNAVRVQYMPLPAGTEQNGDFNLSMIIEFNPGDFNLGEQCKNSEFIIRISDATVNRV